MTSTTSRSENTRATVATQGRVSDTIPHHIGDKSLLIQARGDDFCKTDFHAASSAEAVGFVSSRISLYDKLRAQREEEMKSEEDFPKEEISVELRGKGLNGAVIKAVSWSTRPIELAKFVKDDVVLKALKEVLKNAVVAKVYPTEKAKGKQFKMVDSSGLDDEAEKDHSGDVPGVVEKGQLWDLLRPLEGSCVVDFLDFEHPEGKAVFWHSSAHVLGECLECGFGCHLTVGPPTKNGFFYDCYMGEKTVDEEMKREIEKKAKQVCLVESPPVEGQKQTQIGQKFERLLVSKHEALDLFQANPFKVAMIQAKIPDGGFTTVYRCGPMIDLCMGPHIPNTRAIKGFAVLGTSQANFLGKTDNDSLQRVYGVSFPDEKLLTAHLQNMKEAKDNDHRVRGREQELFFFHPLSPGSAFFEPAGARIYNRLMEFIRQQYRLRGYQEVITPNMYNVDLWKTSGHWMHYAEHMFSFTDGEDAVESPVVSASAAAALNAAEQEIQDKDDEKKRESAMFALKPMNCPGHCLMFRHRDRSYRELPLRMADFGVLHRNELRGALTGLTRVRRFQQDDAHIFCEKSQIRQEVVGALDFMKFVYDTFGMTYRLERSTRPLKAAGLDTPEGTALWDDAEQQLADAMNEFQGEGTWRDNPGDGAFYGPKIDIKVFDMQGRVHQCATVQLDFQLPLRFGLKYSSNHQAPEVPVMVHRAMLGSLERFIAILTEHFRGRWPFWLSPRQAMVIPMLAGSEEENQQAQSFAHEITKALSEFYVEMPNGANDHHNDAIKKAFDMGTKFCLCIGPSEVKNRSVSVEGRQAYGSTVKTPLHYGVCTLDELVIWFRAMQNLLSLDETITSMKDTPNFVKMTYNKGGDKADGYKAGKNKGAKSTAGSASGEPEAKKAPVASPAKPAAAVPATAAFVEGCYVSDEFFPTHLAKLKGRRFADIAAYLAALKE